VCLIVDDSPTVRKIAGKILRGFQIDVDEATDGETAMEKCRARMPELILLDWNMPAMTGIEFLRALRQMENGCYPKVIFCTTEADVHHVREAFEAGGDDYIMKPFDSATLRAKVFGSVAVGE
jgi:two-component system, chemotaxis family, chemotaxis protein CheY